MSNVCGGQGCVCCKSQLHQHEARVTARDPVCGKKLDCESQNVKRLNWDDATFFFCDTRCMTKFINTPKKYIKRKGFLSFFRRLF